MSAAADPRKPPLPGGWYFSLGVFIGACLAQMFGGGA